ncbi:MAG: hypothetical protein QM572_08840 [Nocardioides sp.]|uniref:hypothetical protein n=1 Tax=Nocardioides sp. TaxID=35761 RepID=UPI0039E6A20A
MADIGDPRSALGLVIHAGYRLWPQLDALAQWGDQLEELRLVLAYGDDEEGGPAQRIERFVAEFLPHLKVTRVGTVYDDDPQQTAIAIAAATADRGPWIVDISGGTRLMFAGGVLAASRLPDLAVVFRDTAGPWYQIARDGEAVPLEGISTRAIERFTVQGLLEVTWADEDRRVRIAQPPIEPEIWTAAQNVLAKPERSWRNELEQATSAITRRQSARPDGGLLFERFVLSLLRQMGVAEDDSAVGVKLTDDGSPVQEVDIVVNSNGWLHVIDCKIHDGKPRRAFHPPGRYDPPPLGTQVREAFATRRLLGDGGDQFILLRPNMVIREEFRSLCGEYQINVVDKVDLAKHSLPVILERLIQPPGKV